MSIILNAMQLRALAEWASGYRGEVIDFYEGKGGQIGLWPRSKGPCPHPVILTCDTPQVVKDRPAVTTATLGTAEETLDLLNLPYQGGTVAADAVFWSESSVEKFLFPYYASKGEWEADLYAEALRTVFYGKRPLTQFQDAEEHPEHFQDATNPAVLELAQAVAGEEAFGLVHIPKSDYIPQEQVQALRVGAKPLPVLPTGGELGVLMRHRETGAVRMRMLGEMVREPEGKAASAPNRGASAKPGSAAKPSSPAAKKNGNGAADAKSRARKPAVKTR